MTLNYKALWKLSLRQAIRQSLAMFPRDEKEPRKSYIRKRARQLYHERTSPYP